MSQALEEAKTAIQAGQLGQAQALIAQALRANPRDIDAWLLLEQCVEQNDRKKYCLQQVLLLEPSHQAARQRLADLTAPPAPEPPQPLSPDPVETTLTTTTPPAAPAAEPEPEPMSPSPAPAPEPTPEPPNAEPDFDLLRSASAPPATEMESALMDEASFKPSPFMAPAGSISVNPNDENPLSSIPESPAFTAIAPEAAEDMDNSARLDSTAVTMPGIARNIDKNSIRARLEQAVSNLESGHKAEGIAQLEEVVALDPRNEMAWMWLGAAVDDDVRKREYYQQALAINPRSKMARDYLKAVESRLGSAPAVATAAEAEAPPRGPSLIWLALIAVIVVILGIIIFFVLRRYYLG
jgi:Flp pilus assembly protein TadD